MAHSFSIGLDIQTTLGQKTGFGFYVSALISQLNRLDRFHYHLFRPDREGDLSAPQRFWWDQVVLPARARLACVDLLHQPAFSVPMFYSGKVVVTVHDLIAIVYGQDIPFFSRQYFGHWMPFTYRKANHIIAVSNHTKRDLIKLLNLPEQKITVIYEGVEPNFKPIKRPSVIKKVQKRYQTGGRYFLHLGTLNPRKNLDFLIRIFAQVVRRHPDCRLILTGKQGWYYTGLYKTVARLGLGRHVVFTGYIEEVDKPALYSGAVGFTFPSLYEGFGFPPLEAMACGTPVIASNRSSIPEVVGRAGILLDPNDGPGWVKAIERLLDSSSFAQKLAAQGLVQAKKFNWFKTAQQTTLVYQRVLKEEL